MMSSLCPLPIGTMASIDLIPVSRGTFTDFLVITPGATFSTSQKCLALISFPPSIGSPIPLSTLPRYSSPTPTRNTCQEEVTLSHCFSEL